MMNLFNAGLPVQTVSGSPAFFLAYNPGILCPLLVEVEGRMESYTAFGRHLYNDSLDLKPAPIFGFYTSQEAARFTDEKLKAAHMKELMKKNN